MPVDEQLRPKAVTLDGDIWRDHHGGYQKLVQWGMKQEEPCMFMDAADGLKTFTKPQKKNIFKDAINNKCNILIPETCSSVDRCVEMTLQLKAAGYTVNVFAVIAARAKVFERGFRRQDTTGRFYNTMTFNKCITAVLPIMALADGTCQLIDNTQERPPSGAGPQTRMLQECLNQDKFTTKDWEHAQLPSKPLPIYGRIDLNRLRLAIMDIAGVNEQTFEKDEKRQMKLLEEITKKGVHRS